MLEIKIGDLFCETPAPRRRWRVVAERAGTYELVCIEKPSVSRFARADKLLNGLAYKPEQPAVRSNDHGDEAPE